MWKKLGMVLCLALAICLLGSCTTLEAIVDSAASPEPGPAEAEPSGLARVGHPDGYWVYDGNLFEQESQPGEPGWRPYLLVRCHTEVYGYDQLDEAEQHAFDLCYGEYFSGDIREGGSTFYHFTMPEPLTKDEWTAVQTLYNAAAAASSEYRPFRYACGDATVGKVHCLGDNCPCKNSRYRYHFYVGGVSFSDPELNTAYDRLLSLADEILADLDPGLSEAETCAYIAQYLMEHLTYYTEEWQRTETVGEFTIANRAPAFVSAYGALTEGRANCLGYAESFDLLAKRAGLTSLVVTAKDEGRDVGHAWNMVQVDGAWYQIDVTWMDTNDTPEPNLRWFLFEGGEPKHDSYNLQTYGGYTRFSLPECTAEPYPTEEVLVLSSFAPG